MQYTLRALIFVIFFMIITIMFLMFQLVNIAFTWSRFSDRLSAATSSKRFLFHVATFNYFIDFLLADRGVDFHYAII